MVVRGGAPVRDRARRLRDPGTHDQTLRADAPGNHQRWRNQPGAPGALPHRIHVRGGDHAAGLGGRAQRLVACYFTIPCGSMTDLCAAPAAYFSYASGASSSVIFVALTAFAI